MTWARWPTVSSLSRPTDRSNPAFQTSHHQPSRESCTMGATAAVDEISRLSSEPGQDQRMKDARILIVDDEPLNIEVVQGYLELDGYRNVRSTEHAVQALPLIGEF